MNVNWTGLLSSFQLRLLHPTLRNVSWSEINLISHTQHKLKHNKYKHYTQNDTNKNAHLIIMSYFVFPNETFYTLIRQKKKFKGSKTM